MLAAWTGGELIRLQCYEGIDAAQAVYDWDYARQLLHLRAAEISGEAHGPVERRPRGRPLPAALPHPPGAAALDRARGGGPAGAADRRDRPRRRRVRGVPARGPVRLADHRFPRSACSAPTLRRSSCSPATAPVTSTTPSSDAACTTGSSTRRSSVRWRSSTSALPEVVQRPRPPGRRRRRSAARPQPVQAAGCRRDDRLGGGARPARRQRARRAVRGDDARCRAEVPRGPRAGRPARLCRHRQAGGRSPTGPAVSDRVEPERRTRGRAERVLRQRPARARRRHAGQRRGVVHRGARRRRCGPARRRVLGGAGDAGSPPGGRRRLRPGVRRLLRASFEPRSRRRQPEPMPSRWPSTPMTTTATHGRRSATGPRHRRVALQHRRGAASP